AVMRILRRAIIAVCPRAAIPANVGTARTAKDLLLRSMEMRPGKNEFIGSEITGFCECFLINACPCNTVWYART
ncbi:hypothetical protein AVEN_140532-1, partial [Araneus ventricosus]